MAMKAGVWIDHKQAIVVLVTEAGTETTKIASGIASPVRTVGNSRSKNSYTRNDFIAEDRLERKLESHLKSFFDEVTSSIHGAEALLILGPGEAKGEFHKRLGKKLRGLVVQLETADKMTDRQLAAKVVRHFAAQPAKKFAPPKKANPPQKTAKKQSVKRVSGRSKKNAGK